MGIPKPVSTHDLPEPGTFSDGYLVDIQFSKTYESFPINSFSLERYFSGDIEYNGFGALCRSFTYQATHPANSEVEPTFTDVFGAVSAKSSTDVFNDNGRTRPGTQLTYLWQDVNSYFWFVAPNEAYYLEDYELCQADFTDVFGAVSAQIFSDVFSGEAVGATEYTQTEKPVENPVEIPVDLYPDPLPVDPEPTSPVNVYYAPRNVSLSLRSNKLRVNWNTPLDPYFIDSYNVKILDEGGATVVDEAITAQAEYELVGGIKYRVAVGSIYSDGYEAYSSYTDLVLVNMVPPREPVLTRKNDEYTYNYHKLANDAPLDSDLLLQVSTDGTNWGTNIVLDADASFYTGELPESTYLYIRSRYRYTPAGQAARYSAYSIVRGIKIDNEPVAEEPAPEPVKPPPPPPPPPSPTRRFKGAYYVSPYTAIFPASTAPTFDKTIVISNEAEFRAAMLDSATRIRIIPTAKINITQALSFPVNSGAQKVRWFDSRVVLDCIGLNGNPFRMRGGWKLYNLEIRRARNTSNTNSGIFQVNTNNVTDNQIVLENIIFSGNNLSPIQCFISGNTPILCQDWLAYNFNTDRINNTNAPDAICNINTGVGEPTSNNVTFVRVFANAKYCDDGADCFGGNNVKFYDCAVTNAGQGSYGGDGTGFKLGGARTSASGNECFSCLSFNSKLTGFDHNTSEGGVHIDRCVSYRPFDTGSGYPYDYEFKDASSGDKHTISRSIGREYAIDANTTITNSHQGTRYTPYDLDAGDFSIPTTSSLATQDSGSPIGVSDVVLDGLVRNWSVLKFSAF